MTIDSASFDLRFFESDESVAYSSLEDLLMLVIVGPAGSGKSTLLQQDSVARTRRGEPTRFLNLNGIQTAEEFLQEALPPIAWDVDGAQTWWVAIDGLDTTNRRADEIGDWLNVWLRRLQLAKFDLTRLRVRVATRERETAEALKRSLRFLLDEAQIALFELKGLSLQGAASLAAWLAPGKEVVEQLMSLGLGDLLSSPSALKLLINQLDVHGELPSSRLELYRKTVADSLLSLKDGRTLVLSAGELAASMLLSNTTQITRAPGAAPPGTWQLSIDKMPDGPLQIRIQSFIVDAIPRLEERGLLAVRGRFEYAWTHVSIAEYLAAFFINSLDLRIEEVLRLLRAEVAGRTQVRPHLKEVAAWLALMNAEMLPALLSDDPGLVLDSNAITDDGIKLAVLNALLNLHESGAWVQDWNDSERYSRLAFLGIAEALDRAVRKESGRSEPARIFAVKTILACNAFAAVGALVDIALDHLEPLRLRIVSAHAIYRIGSTNQKAALAAITNLNAEIDPDDELRGWALQSSWPSFLTQNALLDALHPPRNDHLMGSYSQFLYDLRVTDLNEAAMKRAGEWLIGLGGLELSFAFREPAAEIFGKFLFAVERFGLAAQAAEVIAEVIRDFSHPLRTLESFEQLKGAPFSSAEFRRKLFYCLIGIFSRENSQGENREKSNAAKLLYWSPVRVVILEDAEWMLRDGASDSIGLAELLTIVDSLVHFAVRAESLSEVEFIWNGAHRVPGLEAALQDATTIALDSESAALFRLSHERTRRPQEQGPPSDFLEQEFDRLEKAFTDGELGSWWLLNLLLLADGDRPVNEFRGDIMSGANWRRLDAPRQERVLQIARAYAFNPKLPKNWLAPNVHYRPAAALYRALRILWTSDQKLLTNAEKDVWASWNLPILAFHESGPAVELEQQHLLIRASYEAQPEQFVSDAKEFIRVLGRDGAASIATATRDIADEELLKVLWEFWRAHDFSQGSEYRERQIADTFVVKKFQPFLTALDADLADLPIHTHKWRFVTSVLARASSDPGLLATVLPTIIEAQPDVASSILSIAAEGVALDAEFFAALSESSATKIYGFARRTFPEPPTEGGAYFVSDAHRVSEWRRRLLVNLSTKASASSIATLEAIKYQNPDQEWIQYYIEEAYAAARKLTASSLGPNDVLSLFQKLGLSFESTSEAIEVSIAVPLEDLSLNRESTEVTVAVVPLNARRFKFLFFATEWHSAHGGLSTLNRDMTVALAQLGHHVVCFVPIASLDERASATSSGVQLVVGDDTSGLTLEQQLAIGPVFKSDVDFDFVVGHDHPTGPVALAWSKRNGGAKYIHVLHTKSDGIAMAKAVKSQMLSDLQKGSVKGQTNLFLVKASHLSVGVGPLLHDHAMKLAQSERTFELRPGLRKNMLAYSPQAKFLPQPSCLVIGRIEDIAVKGVDLLSSVVNALRSQSESLHHSMPEVVVRGLGKDEDIERLNEIFENKKNLVFKSYSAEVGDLEQDMKEASILLMPSRVEGFGLVALEAVSAGVPILVSDVSGFAVLLGELSKDGHLSSSDLDLMVVKTTGTDATDAQLWASKIQVILGKREEAFMRASKLRTSLSSILTWESAMQGFLSKLESL